MDSIVNFCKQLETYKYISFDIFDTLIFRSISNFRAIHQMVQQLYYERYGNFLDNYPTIRMNAEIAARALPGIAEVSMEMIYQKLTQYNDETKIRLKQLEAECEIMNCTPNLPMLKVLNWCVAKKKIVVITTDMYLPRAILNKILIKIGATYDYLFISGEEGYTKRSGILFDIVLQKLSISPSEIIHIGDDYNNDIAMPQTKGISSLLRIKDTTIPSPYATKIKTGSLSSDHLYSLLSLNYSNKLSISPEHRIGYHVLGPLIVNFCQWVHQVKKEEKIDKLLFVAREGFYIQKVYEEMYPDERGYVSYIHLNKNMLRLPLLSLENPCKYFQRSKLGRPEYEWEVIFDLLFITDSESAKQHIKEQTGFCDFNTKISLKDLENGIYNNILLSLFDYQKDLISSQTNLLHEYINNLGIYTNRIGLVNNSMNGNGQSMLQDFIKANNKQCDIIGIQFIKTPKCELTLKGRCRAWLTENKSISEFKKAHFHNNCLLLEHLMFEPQGTSLFLKKEQGIVKVCCQSPRTEQKDFEKIAHIQKSGLEFTKDYMSHVNLKLNIEGFHNYYQMICHPIYDDAYLLCHLNDDDFDGDKKISNPQIPFKWKYLLSQGIPFDLTWKEGYFKLKEIPELGINLYLYSIKYQYTKGLAKRILKKLLHFPQKI